MKKIRNFNYCGEKEIFIPLLGFSLSDIRETVDSNDEDVVVLRFANEHRVAIDVSVQDDGIMVSEPYAVKEDLTVVTDVGD
mgnify:FL=1